MIILADGLYLFIRNIVENNIIRYRLFDILILILRVDFSKHSLMT